MKNSRQDSIALIVFNYRSRPDYFPDGFGVILFMIFRSGNLLSLKNAF